MKLSKALLASTAILALAMSGASARELTLGMMDNEVSNVYKGVVAFAEKLDELSGGELTVKIFPNSQLGEFKAMVAQIQADELDMTLMGYPDMSYLIPELKLIGAPYVVRDFDHLQNIVNGPWGQKVAAKFAAEGLKVLDVWYLGTRETTSNRPINSIDDMKGLRMRTPNVPFLIAYAESVGATPAPVAFAEVYLALQTNQVDAQENPLPTIEAMKFYEVQSYIAMTNHFIASMGLEIGTNVWDSLSEEEKGWMMEAAVYGGDVSDALTFEQEDSLIAEFESRGVTVTHPDLAPFRAAMKPYYDKLEAEFGAGSIAEVIGD